MRVVNELDKLEQAAARDDMSPLRHLQGRPELRVSIGRELLPNPVLTNRTVGSVDDIPLSNPDEPPLSADNNPGDDEVGLLDEPTVDASGRERDDSFADVGTACSDDEHPALTPELDGDCAFWPQGCSPAQASATPQFDSGLQRSGEQRNRGREGSEQPANRSGETADSRARRAPSSHPHRPRDRPTARMACMSDWSVGPRGLLGGRFGACCDTMHTAVTEDVSHDPATGGVPAGLQAAGTPGPVRLVQPHGDSPFCLREHIVNRFMSGSGLAESQFSMLANPLDDARGSGQSEPYAPMRHPMTELLADILRLSEAAQSADSEAGVPAEVDWEEFEPLLRMLNLPRTLD